MNKDEFLAAVLKLGLDPKDYVVIGSGIMCALGLRKADDIDVCVTKEVFERFEKEGWKRKYFENDPLYYLTKGIYEVGLDFDRESNVYELKETQQFVEGVPFISLQRLRSWKLSRKRPKDLEDIKLIDFYLSKNK